MNSGNIKQIVYNLNNSHIRCFLSKMFVLVENLCLKTKKKRNRNQNFMQRKRNTSKMKKKKKSESEIYAEKAQQIRDF